MNILVLGVTGMLGHTLFNQLLNDKQHKVWGTLREAKNLGFFAKNYHPLLLKNIDVLNQDTLISVFDTIQPDIVINCVGLIKQLSDAKDPLAILPINSMFPHRLAKLSSLANARLIHISTDCVFNGSQGMYKEDDVSDAEDLYGKSKYLGELYDFSHVVTLRTSIIGHELNSNLSLVDWFLSQTNDVNGYKKAIFSGLPTVELTTVIKDYVIPNVNLKGLYHISVDPIDKHSLLKLIAEVYDKKIGIIPSDKIQIDRSLDSTRFRRATGYVPPNWRELVEKMYQVNKGI